MVFQHLDTPESTAPGLEEHRDQLQRQERITASLLKIFECTPEYSIQELLQQILDEAELLTKSKIGFYHFIEKDQQTLSLQMWSSNTMKMCMAAPSGTHYSVEQAGVWVDCVRERRPVIHNDYMSLSHKKGLPEGHAPVLRELVVPVIRNGQLKAILGVGNKESEYTEYDAKCVGQLADLAWEAVLHKQKEEENHKLRDQFVQAQKMESVGRLAGGVAHDFNNMLSIILGHVALALEQVAPAQQLHDDLLEIQDAARRSADLTRQLLAFARRQTIAPKPLDLNAVVGEMLKMVKRLIGEDIDLMWLPGDSLGRVNVDPAQVDQILANLCVNARDAIGGVGKITIETHGVEFDEAYCADHPDFLPGAYIMLAVSDDGCGMEQETVSQIFEPFYTTKDLGKGTGLGLSTVYGIVKQNNGFINVYSEPGKGTTFRIYMARCDAELDLDEDGKTTVEMLYGAETILMVEDDATILNLGKRMLEPLGYHVLTASNPLEALNLAKDYPDEIDLLVTDVVMPDMNGHELAKQLKATRPGVEVLYLSGYTADVIARHGILKKGIHFLQKPFSRQELALKIKGMIA